MEKLMVEGLLLDIEGFINNVIQERHKCVNEQYIYWYSGLLLSTNFHNYQRLHKLIEIVYTSYMNVTCLLIVCVDRQLESGLGNVTFENNVLFIFFILDIMLCYIHPSTYFGKRLLIM